MHRRISGPLLLLSALLLVPDAWGAVRYVSTSGTNNPDCTQAAPCLHIQHAVTIAIAGDTISIGKGKFVEQFGVTIDKNLTLNGAGIFSTRVWGAWPGSSIFRVELGATAIITNLDVMGGNTENGGGISNSGNLTLDRIRVRKNSAKRGGGIFNTGQLSIYSSEIAHNSASISGGGLRNENYAILHEVRIVKNYAVLGGGIENITEGGFPLVQTYRSEISHNAGNGINNLGNMGLYNTTVSRNNQTGIFIGDGHYAELVHVTVAENGGGGSVPCGIGQRRHTRKHHHRE